ncbi:polyprenyl synthetase family protein [Agromyces sp. H3Y2-19a]|uniref:polyprenyl synthetase family protein n=1 Tax=Agromyces chromiiresistens TaxID=3030835 RepID=UPI0023BA0FF6|nr:polyprenyl synthetase family protein [Agromyces chromiiresistens]MDF0513581.1 polyprenyl synthetase family protein [Agromyces chromiiresistens]
MTGVALDAAPRAAITDIDDEIEAFFATRIARAVAHDAEYAQLWTAARDSAAGGKRLRPELVLAAHAAYAGAGHGEAVRLALAFELLHTAFLMHDDVIDHDLVRRGAPNVTGRFMLEARARGLAVGRARDYGEAAAILAGDLLISAAHRIVAEVEAPDRVRAALLDVLDDCVFLTAAGEHADVRQATASPTRHEIIAMIERKTAWYSFSAPLQAGALLGGAPRDAVDRLGEVGRHLGVAFQLRDDVLGVFGTSAVTGKSVVGDLREGKQTLLIAWARSDPAWRTVADDFGRPDLDDAAAARLREVIESTGARARVEAVIRERHAEAVAAIEFGDFPSALRAGLLATASGCVGRER